VSNDAQGDFGLFGREVILDQWPPAIDGIGEMIEGHFFELCGQVDRLGRAEPK
jgi:hypothetical protein